MIAAVMRLRFAPALALFFLVLGGRLWFIDRAGSDLPVWDQWWAEFETVIVRLADDSFSLYHLAEQHNEHRLFFQRLSTYALVTLSGRWEPRDELVVSAFVRAAGLLIVFLALARHQSPRIQGILLGLLTLLGALPVGVFNLLSGFQMQFFVAEPLTVLALAFLFLGPLNVERLAIACALLLLALVNMATPVITALSAAAVLGLRIALRRGVLSANLAVASLLGVFGFFAFATSAGMAHLQAEGLWEFLSVFAKLAAWPFPESPVLGLIALAPPLLLLHRVIRDAEAANSAWFVLALSATGWLQMAAIAFARAKSAETYPQYVDGLWFGHVVSLVALGEALRPKAGETARLQTRACTLWGFWLMSTLLSDAALRGVPNVEAVRRAVALRQPDFAQALEKGGSATFAAEVRHVYQMMVAKDFSFLDHPAGRFAIPGRVYSQVMNDREKLKGLLPARLVGAPLSATSSVLQGTTRLAPLVIVLGLILLIAALSWKPAPAGPGAGKSDLDG